MEKEPYIVREFQSVKKRYVERAYLVGIQDRLIERFTAEDSLKELEALAESAGAVVAGSVVVRIDRPNPATYIGSGKAEEITRECVQKRANLIIFDDNLSPAQVGALENIIGVKVVDRTELILDIFAQRARTREGKLQIEMAQLSYLFPRLTRRWTHLSRQEGGIGTRGPGETQLEVDRRRVREKMTRLKNELARVVKQRAQQRKKRKRSEVPIVSIVGYTNAGKSTLMNTLTGTDVFIADKLFATLDPTTRKFRLRSGKEFFITDTVGFIKKLPHQLVDSFRATLEEVIEADILILVIDISQEKAYEHKKAVEIVLEEIGAKDKLTIYALNKIDLIGNWSVVDRFMKDHPDSVPVSARSGEGIVNLLRMIERHLVSSDRFVEFLIPDQDGGLLSTIYKTAVNPDVRRVGDKTYVRVRLPFNVSKELKKYVAGGDGPAQN